MTEDLAVETLGIEGPLLLTPRRFPDTRGVFCTTYRQDWHRAAGIAADFVQDNRSLSAAAFTLRGLHCQLAPAAQGKLVRCPRGAVWDVAVDVRAGSPTYGRHVAAELSEENWRQLWIPPGFLHGFLTLRPGSAVEYKVTALYAPTLERGVRWDDPRLAIPWPLAGERPALSPKDAALPGFEAAAGWFP